MRRPAIDTVLRSLKNALANWPLVIFRVVEFGIFLGIAFVAIVTTILPVAITAGLGKLNVRDVEGAGAKIVQFITDHSVLITWFLGASLIALTAMLAIHSFVVAGSARVYRDAERATHGDLASFYIFDLDVFWEAAWDGWGRAFWIYNLGIAGASLIVLVPALFGALLMFVLPGGAVVIAALTALAVCLFGFIAAIFGGVWVFRALGEAASRECTAREALGFAWSALRASFGHHFLVGVVVAIISIGGTSFIEAIAGMIFDSKFIETVVQTICWGLSSAWMLAAYVSLVEEKN